MKNNKLMLVILGLIILGGGYYLFASRSGNEAVLEESRPAVVEDAPVTPSAVNETPMEETSIKIFEVTAGSYYYDPTTITVNRGDMVKIILVNDGGVHDLVIDEYDVRTKILNADERDEITFTADQVGVFKYYCSVGNHRQMGMVGSLVVE